MITQQDIEQAIPFIKPLFDGLRSAKDFFKRDHKKSGEHDLEIPKKTLILLPDVRPFSLRWTPVEMGTKEAMQLFGKLQATNTSKFNIRPSGLKLLRPHGVEIQNLMLFTSTDENFILKRSIGEIIFGFWIAPVVADPGASLAVIVSILDQFGNEHVTKDLVMRYAGPEPSPDGVT
jgi:hypothetical protein